LERNVIELERRENRAAVLKDIATTAGLHLSTNALWLLLKAGREHTVIPTSQLDASTSVNLALAARTEGDQIILTAAGREVYDKIVLLYRQRFATLLERWEPDRHEEARAMLKRLAVSLLSEPATSRAG
jgi:hypothetical protein